MEDVEDGYSEGGGGKRMLDLSEKEKKQTFYIGALKCCPQSGESGPSFSLPGARP